VFAWAVGGVLGVLVSAAVRLGSRGVPAFLSADGTGRLVAVVWLAWMLLTAAWPGFHRQFAPRVAARARRLAEEPPSWRWGLAPAVAMGLLHAPPRRLAASWGLWAAIGVFVAAFRWLGEPWRGLLDLGVAAALASGASSVAWFATRAWAGTASPVDDGWP
jgi:hypothetical protein